MKREVLSRRDGPVLGRRSWPVFSWGCVIALGIMYAWGFRVNAGRGDPGGLWLVAAVMCATAAIIRQLGTCAMVLRREILVVLNPIGSQEVSYDEIRQVAALRGGSLKIFTLRDELLYPVGFSGSLADYLFHTSEKAADAIRERLPRVARLVRKSVLAAIVGGVVEAVD
ncbi:hypothetical protein ACGFY9_12480 [Streptomyces sp. NPDC048504]|uniref:hypothetical protein n=1 Tax=Streptomyces sp. NPDC048504 TaxID=3365559 RepID=UPI0037115D2D